jgi:Dual-action HEIGH metallo-peptidase
MRSGWGRGILALGAMWMMAACTLDGQAEIDIPSWETYLEWSTREFEGRTIYVAEGDVAVTLEELRAHYDEWVAAVLEAAQDSETGIGRTEQESTVNVVNGVDDLWALGVRRDITYCVSDDFGTLKNRAVAEMVNATRDWERHANVNFRHLWAHDAACNNSNGNVTFSVRPWTSGGACAFFPSGGGCVPRTLVMNFSSFATGAVTSQGVFKHELGHVLGLRHEHIRVAGNCTETGASRAVTAYDSNSVMHYPWCPGATNTADLFLTANDIAGVRSLYGPASAHGFAWVTAAGAVSSTYAHNSLGGTVSAYRVEPVLDPGAADPGSAAVVFPPPIFTSGQYIVTFGGMGGLGGNVEVVGYGTTSTRCKVAGWNGSWPGNLTVDVRCHLPDGTPAWSAFVVQYSRKATLADGQGGYVRADMPTSPAYCPSLEFSWNSADDLNCVVRNGTGDYSVSFGTLASVGGVGGSFQVTAFGTGGEHCKIQFWGTSGSAQQARVRCFNPAGSPADTQFSINHFPNGEVGVHDYGAYAWASNSTATSYTPSTTYSYNSGRINGWPGCVGYLGTIVGGKVDANPGHYFLRYQYLTPFNSAAHSTAYGSDSSYCKVESWYGVGDAAQVQTQCYSANGAKQNSLYVGTYATSFVRGPC